MANRAPAYQTYPRDALVDIALSGLTLEERGAWTLLSWHCWIEEGLPLDFDLLGRLLRVKPRKAEALVGALVGRGDYLFHEENGRLFLGFQEKERGKHAEKSQKAADSAKVRWGEREEKHSNNAASGDANALRSHGGRNARARASAVAVAVASAVEETEQPPSEVVGALARATPHPVVNGGSSKLRAGTALTVTEVTGRLAGVLAEVQASTERRLTKDEATAAAAQLVFGYWATKTNSTRSLYDRDRERVLRRALSENRGNVSELMYAVDGALHDPWHNGDRDGTKHLGVDAIFRNRGKIEELAEKRPGYRSGEMHPMAERYRQAFEGGGATP